MYAEHIMPYFEGEVNLASMNAFGEVSRRAFDLEPQDMKVMHIPERVMHSDSGWAHAKQSGPLRGNPFEDILEGGYEAAYLDEVLHLHWWFYPDQTNNPGWDDSHFGKWSGHGGNDEESYHHKLHRVHGVMLFMINDREDKAKFDNYDGGMARDTRYSLLEKAMSPDQAQITVVFDDWEAFAGNSFRPAVPNDNADRWHSTIRWAANKQWTQVVNLQDALEWAREDPEWSIDHGKPDGKSTQTYEWLKRAAGGSYDNWYYGSELEESFFDRVPPVSPAGARPEGMKTYGDMNTQGTLIRDTWDRIRSMPVGDLRHLAELSYSALIYETAWHDEDADPSSYQSKNYQTDFNRVAPGIESRSDTTYDKISDWALELHGAIRRVGVIAAAAEWAEDIKSGEQSPRTVVEARDIDDDTQPEYILRNDRAFLCFERWGGRLVAAFSRDPSSGDVV